MYSVRLWYTILWFVVYGALFGLSYRSLHRIIMHSISSSLWSFHNTAHIYNILHFLGFSITFTLGWLCIFMPYLAWCILHWLCLRYWWFCRIWLWSAVLLHLPYWWFCRSAALSILHNALHWVPILCMALYRSCYATCVVEIFFNCMELTCFRSRMHGCAK